MAQRRIVGRLLVELPAESQALEGVAGVEALPDEEGTELHAVPLEDTHPWDAAHKVVAEQRLLESAAPVRFAEPDFLQVFRYRRAADVLEGATLRCATAPPNADWPSRDEFAWHLSHEFSGLKSAREAVHNHVGDSPQRRIRIGILDTGYDPGHFTLPEHLNLELAANFVETDRPNDPTDPAANPVLESLMENPGHGTATLALLAGGKIRPSSHPIFDDYLGGAPHAEVVPIRIANSVLHFYSSSMAKGLDHAVRVGCDVISISMGGVPTRAWAKAVNRAYEAGVTICAAAGNNIAGLPTTSLVFPARFRRVIAVCGATAEKRPYFKHFGYVGMQGNAGPVKPMESAVTAYTPNVPWSEIGCPEVVGLDGGGTSAATPQVAAAAALWLQRYAAEHTPDKWRRVEAVRKALFSSADKSIEEDKFGNGLLRAAHALDIAPDLDLPKTPGDHAWFPWIRVVFGLEAVADPRDEMYELEALQLFMTSPELQKKFGAADPQTDELEVADQRTLMQGLVDDRRSSSALRDVLAQRLREL